MSAAEARRALNESSLINEWPIEERATFAARAQAEATLALAYEQRTANLLALFAQIDTYLGSDMKDGQELAAQIRERLDLP